MYSYLHETISRQEISELTVDKEGLKFEVMCLLQLKDHANQINDEVLAIFDLNLVPYHKLYSILIQVL